MVKVENKFVPGSTASSWLELNDPERLNVLGTVLLRDLNQEIDRSAEAKKVKSLILSAKGRCFCAGGDVKAVSTGNVTASDYFFNEYETLLKLRNYSKPVVMLGHGYVFGGGWGLFDCGTTKFADANTFFSMPEIAIGFFCDVGARKFLTDVHSRRAPRIAKSLALTGYWLNSAQAFSLGFIDGVVSQSQWGSFVTDYVRDGHLAVQHWRTSTHLDLNEDDQLDLETLESLGNERSLFDFSRKLKSASGLSERFEAAQARFFSGSAFSAQLIWRQFDIPAFSNWTEQYAQEFAIAAKVALHPDFREGVRATLVDKDKRPRWQYNNREFSDARYIGEYFNA